MDGLIEAMTRPLEIINNNQKVLRDAMASWNREFKSDLTEVKLAFVEKWQKNPNVALQFVLLDLEDRQFLVRKKIPLRIQDGQNGQKDQDSKSWDDIDEFIEELEKE